MLDGIDLKGRCCIVALGIDVEGVKIIGYPDLAKLAVAVERDIAARRAADTPTITVHTPIATAAPESPPHPPEIIHSQDRRHEVPRRTGHPPGTRRPPVTRIGARTLERRIRRLQALVLGHHGRQLVQPRTNPLNRLLNQIGRPIPPHERSRPSRGHYASPPPRAARNAARRQADPSRHVGFRCHALGR
jgi:hypothetical protein